MVLDAKDQPVKTLNGDAKLTTAYDMHGRAVEEAYWDESGHSTPHKGGYAIIRKSYDTRGQLIQETLFDPAGQLAHHDDRYVKRKYAYDHREYQIERAYHDAHDPLTFHTNGHTKRRSKYSDKGQLLEIAYIDLDGALVLHKKHGYAKRRSTYNERGKVDHIAYFDSQNHLAQNAYGYATRKYIYDDHGQETQRVFLNVNEAPVHTRVAIQDMEPDRNSQRLGFQVGEQLLGYDGEDVRNTHIFDELLKGERPRALRILRQGKFVSIDLPPGRLQGLELGNRVPPEASKPGT